MIKAVLFDMDDTLIHGWAAAPELRGQPCEGVTESLERIQQMNIPIAICTNQANILYHHFQEEIIRQNPGWKRKNYTSASQVVENIVNYTSILKLNGARWYIAIWDERLRRLLIPSNEETLNEIHTHITPQLPIEQAERVAQKMERDIHEKGIIAQVSANTHWRKPEPGMLSAAASTRNLSPSECLYIGDMDGSRQDKSGQPMSSDRDAAHNAGMHFLSAKYMSIIPDVIEMFNLAEEGEDGERLSMLAEICGRAGVGIDRGKISTKEI